MTQPPPDKQSRLEEDRPRRVLLGVTGSVAAIKVPKIVKLLTELRVDVQVVATKAAYHFFDPTKLAVKCYTDEEEWAWEKQGDPILHIELRRWADLLLIAPLDANTMAKIATGICNNLLTCVVRAWDAGRPLLFCPAMNTYMWEHPITATQLQTLKSFGYIELPPVSKMLACGDEGIGAMANAQDIVETVIKTLK